MLLERLRKGVISDEDLKFIARTMQSLVYGTRSHMAQAIDISPRSIRRIFNAGHATGPQHRIDIFTRYLRDVEAALDHPQFEALSAPPRAKPRPKR